MEQDGMIKFHHPGTPQLWSYNRIVIDSQHRKFHVMINSKNTNVCILSGNCTFQLSQHPQRVFNVSLSCSFWLRSANDSWTNCLHIGHRWKYLTQPSHRHVCLQGRSTQFTVPFWQTTQSLLLSSGGSASLSESPAFSSRLRSVLSPSGEELLEGVALLFADMKSCLRSWNWPWVGSKYWHNILQDSL